MIIKREPGEIKTWFVVFERETESRILRALVRGEFKHVKAFGFCPEAATWVFVDPTLRGTRAILAPHFDGPGLIESFTGDSQVIKIAKRFSDGAGISVLSCCTSAVRSLIGLPGAGMLRALPDSLYRDCLKAGGVSVVDRGELCVEKLVAV